MAKREKSGAVLAKTWNPRVVLEKTLARRSSKDLLAGLQRDKTRQS